MRKLPLALALSALGALLSAQEDPGVRPLADAVQLLGWPLDQAREEGPDLEDRTEGVSSLLQCPVCQGLSVADSPSSMARNMRDQVRDLVSLGYDQDQVLSYFERSYGEFVRMKPPVRGLNWLVWLAPVLGLLGCGAMVGWALHGHHTPQKEAY